MAMMEIPEAYGVMADGNDTSINITSNRRSVMMNPAPPIPIQSTKRVRSQRRRRSSLNFASLDFPSFLSHVPPPPPPLPAARVCLFSLIYFFDSYLCRLTLLLVHMEFVSI